ncbi:TetR family transcriptional regulator [Clostridium sp. HMP27]|uniref:TetR/AcrR family transcriptional regulator n=1 Tax=Clostridium sp. HMP27 TaxID=1487921 RepID=UPI00052C5A05|nr:TetR family transcriptional regulator [Clostridium sp. HMP27]KGK90271.1 TetR family transcriptional regulator [Clostridium sp. HMP27]
MVFKRARSEEQKNIRRDQIIEATIRLLENEPLEKITLASIASELNFSRANLYKYVTTREEIFLWIVASDAEKWVEGLQQSLENYDHLELKTFCYIWAEQIYQNKRLVKLFSLLTIVLEKSSTLTAFETFKQDFYSNFSQLRVIIKRLLPDLSNEQFRYFIHYQMHYALGQFSSIVSNEKQRQALKVAKSSCHKRDFVLEFAEYLEVIITGLQTVKK